METILRASYVFSQVLPPHTNAVRLKRYDNGALSMPWPNEGNNLEISVPVPGLGKDDLYVYLEDRVLNVRSKSDRVAAIVSNGRTNIRHSFVVPGDVDSDRIEAKCRDGLLTIKLKRNKPNRSVSIKVQGTKQGRTQQVPLSSWWKKLKAKAGIGVAKPYA